MSLEACPTCGYAVSASTCQCRYCAELRRTVSRNGIEFSKFFAGLTRDSLKRVKTCHDEFIKMLDNPHAAKKK